MTLFILKNSFKTITYKVIAPQQFSAKKYLQFVVKEVVFSETTYYYLRKVRSCFFFNPVFLVTTL
jgi:hypothetical protein